MATAAQIREALSQLDVSNDSHWTQDGAPAVAAVEAILGEDTNRTQINRAANDFTRASSAAKPEAVLEAQGEDAPEAGPVAPVVDAPSEAPEAAAPEAPVAEEPKDEAVLEGLTLADVQARIQEGYAFREKLSREIDHLIELEKKLVEVEAPPVESFTHSMRHFLETQNALRVAAVEAQERTAAGLSALDEAMSAKRGFGMNRPNFAPVGEGSGN